MYLLIGHTTFIPIVTGPVVEAMNYFDHLVYTHRLPRGFCLNF